VTILQFTISQIQENSGVLPFMVTSSDISCILTIKQYQILDSRSLKGSTPLRSTYLLFSWYKVEWKCILLSPFLQKTHQLGAPFSLNYSKTNTGHKHGSTRSITEKSRGLRHTACSETLSSPCTLLRPSNHPCPAPSSYVIILSTLQSALYRFPKPGVADTTVHAVEWRYSLLPVDHLVYIAVVVPV